jgi:anaerobic C4-dicarboxylate transporter DcuA
MKAGVVAVISILGIAWLGSTFFEAHQAEILAAISSHIRQYPWLFSFALFLLSILLYSQAATVAALMGVGLQLGIAPPLLIAMFPAVNGYFFLPTYATIVAAIQFDSTGTTGVGRWLLNHSFMRAGLVTTTVSVGVGLFLAKVFYS